MCFRTTSIGNMNKTFHRSNLQDIPKTHFGKKFHPEAGVIINNTNNITEADNADNYGEFKMDAIERVVNNKILPFTSTRKNQTIKFNTKKYYNEGVRISLYPP